MDRAVTAIFVVFFVICVSAEKKLPPDMPLCKRSDPDLNSCLKSAIQNSIKVLKSGIPDLDMPPVDPLHLHETRIEQNDNGPIRIKLTLTHTDLFGLSNTIISSVDADWNAYRIRINVENKDLSMVGDYEIDGKLMAMFIIGKGKFNITLEGGDGHIELFGKGIEKDGHTYMDVQKLSWEYKPVKMFINFDNLFNGDKEKSEKVNAFLNAEWEDLYNEMSGTIRDTYADGFKEFTRILFDRVPIDSIAIP